MKVQILMSTYNGEQFIDTQLNSIIAQDYPNKELLIRDDGSTDQTVNKIRKYQAKYPWIKYYGGMNLGVQKSFFDLISNADLAADYFAFSDQDDEWHPHKLGRAIEFLEQASGYPTLYCSNTEIVDDNLNPIKEKISRKVVRLSFGNALVQNICTGCTAVINRRLLNIIRQEQPSYIIMHDWWLYLAASCFGKVYYDNNSYIHYRQHGKNLWGAMLSKRKLLRYRLRQLREPRGEIYLQAEEFHRIYSESSMPEENKMLLSKLIKSRKCFRYKLRLMLDDRVYRQKNTDNAILRLIILLGRL